MRIKILLLLFLFCFINISGSDICKLIEDGDNLYEQRADVERALLAMRKYVRVLALHPDNFDALWKVSRTAHYLVDEISDKAKKRKIVELGIRKAKKAIKIAPERVEGYFWLGVNYAKEGQVKGILKSLFRISPIKKNMRKVIDIDKTYEGGGAYLVLGRVYSQVPGILGGSSKKALANLLKAKEICSSNPLVYLFLAEVYVDMGRREDAVNELTVLEKLKNDKRWIPETIKKKREGREMLNKLLSGRNK